MKQINLVKRHIWDRVFDQVGDQVQRQDGYRAKNQVWSPTWFLTGLICFSTDFMFF